MSRLNCAPLAPLRLFSVAVLLGCGGGGGDGNGGTPPPTTAIAKTSANSGDAQSGTVGQPLANPLRVVVTEDGAPLSGATVAWATTAAGGSVDPASAATDADGVANTTWTLGTTSGAQAANATLAGATGSPVTFSATALAGAAATLAQAGGGGQTGETNAQLGTPLQAKVTDQFGNAVAGTDVNWSTPPETGASVSAPTVASNSSGVSQVTVTLGSTAGPITITAEANDLAGSPLGGSPLSFAATAVAPVPPPTNIAISVNNDFFRSGQNQTTGPAVDTLAVGGTVTWTWVAIAASHNVTSNPPPGFASSSTQTAGATYKVVFPTAGTYRYYCTIHASATSTSGMIGRIVVR